VEACDLARGGGGWGEERLEKEFRDFVDLRDRERGRRRRRTVEI
jgi:hypothetical protein